MKYPFANPMTRRPTYSAPMCVVVIMMMLATQQVIQAIQRQALRPSLLATRPAVPELMNAPRVMSEEINCCLSVAIFQPVGEAGVRYPYICIIVSINHPARQMLIPVEIPPWPEVHQSYRSRSHIERDSRSLLHKRGITASGLSMAPFLHPSFCKRASAVAVGDKGSRNPSFKGADQPGSSAPRPKDREYI